MAFTNWLAALVIGVSGGFLLLIFPSLGLLLITLGAIGILRAQRRMAGVAGLLIGAGSIILALLVRAQMACQAFDAAPNQGCEAPDITPHVVLASGLLVAGVLGSLLALRRRRSG